MATRSFAVVAVLLTSAALAAESPIKILGPEVGQRFPHTLAAVDQAGKTQSLKSLIGQKGLAVFFVRSADWCPFCKGSYTMLSDPQLHDIEAAGL
jgi:thiol-disulfide isomerase/thioredoxin